MSLSIGMLGLGALSRGCFDEMSPHLPSLLPFLLSSVRGGGVPGQEYPPELRCISAWVIARYCHYWFDSTEDRSFDDHINTQKEIIGCLLNALVDPHPKLQAAVCAAFCGIFESASLLGRDEPVR
jgi:transportin-1